MACFMHQPQGVGSRTTIEDTNLNRTSSRPCYTLLWKEQWLDHRRNPNLQANIKIIQDQSIPSSQTTQGIKKLLPEDYISLLRACTKNKDLQRGTQLHDRILKQGLLDSCADALVTMYAKCGALEKAKALLNSYHSRDVISWTALIAGYVRAGLCEDALACFEHMLHKGISPNAVTYACLLKACGILSAASKGKQFHEEILKQGLLQNDMVLGGALVDMYAKCGSLAKAQRVLENLTLRDVVSWSALIAGYVQQGQGQEALKCFECMRREGIHPNAVTYACILKACGILGDVGKGKQIHDEILSQGLLQNDFVLGGALVDMYAKCGDLARSQRVFDELPSRNVVSWCALIAGYAQKGQGEEALKCFDRMQNEGIPPNAVTMCCVLNVCSQLGLVEEGHMYFSNMGAKYGLQPAVEVYACMIDLLGRAGHLEKAVKLIRDMPSCNHSTIWHALLAACGKWGDVSVGRWAFWQAIQLDKRDGAAHILMANIYAAAGMQENAKSIEVLRMENNA
ncbi:hypothetical protein GOP47_0015159 [Adiantum capillus-veneris]|uniref:Pentatricopeptide repeat-containing protein n=1 Tax=Adiantum capillus-veneris TaxID=13818 RepID=A0A9D4UNI3_ADICA|nr:hypothetical protein GOP47_0015159 [Adiantum capillus-veneris]